MDMRLTCRFCKKPFVHASMMPGRPPGFCGDNCREKARRRRLRQAGICQRCRKKPARSAGLSTCAQCYKLESRKKNSANVARRIDGLCRDCGGACSPKPEGGLTYARCDPCRKRRAKGDRLRRIEKQMEPE